MNFSDLKFKHSQHGGWSSHTEINGHVLSVQCGERNYCDPREDLSSPEEYSTFEIAIWESTDNRKWCTPRFTSGDDAVKGWASREEIEGVIKAIERYVISPEQAKSKLIDLLINQITDLTTMSKIELGDDVIAEINRLKNIINLKPDSVTAKSVSEARKIMESFDDSPAMTVGYDKPAYNLTSEQMIKIAGALYLADCLIFDLEGERPVDVDMPGRWVKHEEDPNI